MLNIESVLKEKRMTQTELARLLGVSTTSVNAVVCGRVRASERLLARYAEALGVPIERLYDNLLRGS